MNEKVKQIIKFMQGIDPNGRWDEIEEDVKNGNTTLENELLSIMKTMEEWKTECASKEQAELIREYLREIKEIYNC